MEHCVPVDLCAQMHEDGAKTDRCPVHQDKFTRRFDPSNAFQLGMHLPRKIAASLAIAQLLDGSHPILEQRSIDETGPHVQHINRLIIKPSKPPTFIGVNGQVAVLVAQRPVEINHSTHKLWSEKANRAEIHQVYTVFRINRIVAQMRVTMDHPIEIERHIPDPKHLFGNVVARLLAGIGLEKRHHALTFKPTHGQQPVGRQIGPILWQADTIFITQHIMIKLHIHRFTLVIQLFAEPLRELVIDIGCRNR